MRTTDLDNKQRNWKISGRVAKNNDTKHKSKYHLKARVLLKQIFPTCKILEEVSVPIRSRETLYLDFFLPLHKLCIEVHGQQHYEFIPFYHGTRLGFAQAKKRDRDKVEWCEQNGITVVELPYSEKENEWRKRIEDR